MKTAPQLYLLILILACGPLIGCTGSTKKNTPAKDMVVEDFRGQKIQFSTHPQRVVCLIESALTGIYMLGQGSRVVGIPGDVYQSETFKYYAPLDQRIASHTLPAPGNWDIVSIEKVVALQPDLVIIWAHQSQVIHNLEQFGIAVYGVMLNNTQDIFKEISDFGKLFNCELRANQLISYTKNNLELLDERRANQPQKSAYFMWAQGINETSGIHSTVHELLQFAGLRNVCNLPQEHVTINIEKLIDWDPDLIIMWYNPLLDPDDLINNPLLGGLRAVKQGQVYELPSVFECDLWTLKIIYPASLISYWAYQNHEQTSPDQLFKNLYNTDLHP